MNNAGLMNNTRILDEDKMESNFCVNTLGKPTPTYCTPVDAGAVWLVNCSVALWLCCRNLSPHHQTLPCAGEECSASSGELMWDLHQLLVLRLEMFHCRLSLYNSALIKVHPLLALGTLQECN